MDIVQYSSQSVELQIKWKERFNGYLAEAIRDAPESERVILDTGDGAAVCFLGAPEAAMFAALQLCRAFVLDEQQQQQGLRVRLGINMGPVKLVRDINGALNAIGDGINAAQRVMSFAAANRILVSQSFYDVVSRVSDDYRQLFELKGVERDKHVREHTVYHLLPPGSERPEPPPVEVSNPAAATAKRDPADADRSREPARRKGSPVLIAGGVAAAVVLLAAGAWLYRSQERPKPDASASPDAQAQRSAPVAAPANPAAAPAPAAVSAKAPAPSSPPAPRRDPEPAAAPKSAANPANEPAPAASSLKPVSAEAKAAYDEGSRLLDEDQAAEAARHFDDAIRANPDYLDAYLGRAEARRSLDQLEASVQDCAKAIQIARDDARGYNCRGFGRQRLKQYDLAISDFNEAIRLNPKLALAYEHRGTTYGLLEQYDRAVEDYSQAISLRPRMAEFYLRRATLYGMEKQYQKAVQDYTECLRLEPNNIRAYRGRASAEQAMGDSAGAAADRLHAQQMRKKKGN